MRKIHMTRQFFEVQGIGWSKFRVYIFFRRGQKAPRTDKQTNRHTYLQVKMGISTTGRSPQVDFEIKHTDMRVKIGIPYCLRASRVFEIYGNMSKMLCTLCLWGDAGSSLARLSFYREVKLSHRENNHGKILPDY